MALLNYRQLGDVARSTAVRKALSDRADRIAANARRTAQSEGARDIHVRRTDGTRPKGRPYARVSADIDQEYGTARTARRRILGRSIR